MPKPHLAKELTVDRRSGERRSKMARREETTTATQTTEPRTTTRRKVERRRQIDPTTCERDYTADEIDFMKAMDEYKRKSGRQFPTWSEVLEVLHSMGYRRIAEPTEILPESNN